MTPPEELARFCDELGAWLHKPEQWRSRLKEVSDTLRQQAEQIEALSKDKARLDWLEKNMGYVCNEIKGVFNPSDRSPNIRQSIDAAMSAQTEENAPR